MAIFSRQIASFLGNPEIWLAVAVSGIILPMFSISGIFSAMLQKNLNFKKIFIVRVVTSLIPLFVTIQMSVIGFQYWYLVIGKIASVFVQMLVFIIIGDRKISSRYSWKLLKEMYSYSFWTMFDGIAVWLTNWIDSLIIAKYMNEYYLGIYKNSLSTVNALFSIVTASIIPVLFVGLSKYQDDNKAFSTFFSQIQQRLAMILIPIGVGIFIYQDLAVKILFGDKWDEAAAIVGITALTTALRTVFVSICSDAYRAKGKFKIPLFLQIVDICLIVPTCIISAKFGFWSLVYARALIKLDLIIPEMIIMKKSVGIESVSNLKNMLPIVLSTAVMSGCCIIFQTIDKSMVWSFFSILIAVVVYFAVLLIFPLYRKEIISFVKSFKSSKISK